MSTHTDISAPTFRTALANAIFSLTEAGCDTPRLDAEVLLAHVLGHERSWLFARYNDPITPSAQHTFDELVARRVRREPVAYIIGHREFYGLDFVVTPDVLIPRPETEHLIERIIASVPLDAAVRIVDVGTGSGCIAVTLATQLPNAKIWAVDKSIDALKIARQNAMQHGVVERITFVEGDLLTTLAGTWDIIVSNPPYVTDDEWADTMPEVRDFEPRLALTAGSDGLDVIQRLFEQAQDVINPAGCMLVEIGHLQGPTTADMAKNMFPTANVKINTDLAGHDRYVFIGLDQG